MSQLYVNNLHRDGHAVLIVGSQRIAIYHNRRGVVLPAYDLYKFRPALVGHQRMMEEDHGGAFFQQADVGFLLLGRDGIDKIVKYEYIIPAYFR
jgi:hypothetical protein